MIKSFSKIPFFAFFKKMTFLMRGYHFLVSFLSGLLFLFPSRRLFLIGVTGTKGKTTVVELIDAILREAGKKTAVISSLYFKIGDEIEKNLTDNTMPGRFFIQRFLKKSVAAQAGYALVEVTSEGVRYSRHRFVKWDMAVLTNLAPEHIESHGSFEKYRAAKLSFLKYARKKGAKIFLNGDDDSLGFFKKALQAEGVVVYSKKSERVEEIKKENPGQILDKKDKSLFELFNGENLAAALSVARSLGVREAIITEALRSFSGVEGRLDIIQEEPFRVLIDYAHTPESLEKLFRVVSGETKSRLICVLGSAGGGRDSWKRPVMGGVADKYCSEIILTDEDPYDENPEQIVEDVKKGIKALNKVRVCLSRREAIREALQLAREGDAVVITGKGSEPYIHIKKGERLPWSDRGVTQEELGKKKPR